MTVQIVILAMIAAFLGLQLYRVLGRRAEHEEEPIPGRFEEKPGAPPAAAPRALDRPGVQQNPPRPDMPPATLAAERGIREIAAADRRFDMLSFLEGAKGAYRMVLEAYWRGDKEELSQLCDQDVYDGFAAAIDARTKAGEVLENKLVRIEDTAIVAASYDAPIARITVRFTADVSSVTRDAKGNVIAGSLDDALVSNDVWSFSRNLNSSSPDWLLDETDEG
ncbi:MAG: Tim44/TimA family putative adaptor protein [Novosphingobium sp.]